MRMARRLIAVLAVAALVTGCGGGAASSGGDAEDGGRTRAVKHAMGTTKVPAHPERVVVLDTGELDAAVTLGVTPVGIPKLATGNGKLDYLADKVKNAKTIGTITEPNLESIAALNPDLILGSTVRYKDLYDELSGIAPTVLADSIGYEWKDSFLLYAEALGKLNRAKKKLAAYEKRAKALGRKIGNSGRIQVSVVRFLPEEIRLYQKHSYIGSILADVGLGRPESQRSTEELRVAISPERVQQAAGDVIFVTTWGDPKETAKNKVMQGKLWQRMDAVQDGDVYQVSDDHWMVGLGLGAAQEVLNDLEKYLPKVKK